MTWLGDTTAKPSDAKKAKLELDRAALVKQIEDFGKINPATFRFPHQKRQHQEDMLALANKVTKIDQKLGRPIDRNSGG